jgi:transglutaminase-like putative cysteine protease
VRISIDHTTRYVYEVPVRYSTQYLRVVPQSSARQKVIEWRLDTPVPATEVRDGYGNILHVLTIDQPVREIVIRSAGVVETSAAIDEASDEAPLSPLVFLRPTALTRPERPLVELAEAFRPKAETVAGLQELGAAVLARLPFRHGVTEVHSTAAEALGAGNGVCQDHAHVFITCCRHLGIPTRYVSGYMYSPGPSQTAVASHAWAEAWLTGRWRSFDVTNGRPAGERHIRLAVGADYLDACPVRGVRSGGGEEQMIASALVGDDRSF